jgi:hypothetical protein
MKQFLSAYIGPLLCNNSALVYEQGENSWPTLIHIIYFLNDIRFFWIMFMYCPVSWNVHQRMQRTGHFAPIPIESNFVIDETPLLIWLCRSRIEHNSQSGNHALFVLVQPHLVGVTHSEDKQFKMRSAPAECERESAFQDLRENAAGINRLLESCYMISLKALEYVRNDIYVDGDNVITRHRHRHVRIPSRALVRVVSRR